MKYDKDKIKNELTLTQVFDLVNDLGGEPILKNDYFISKTICHNVLGEGSYKLYYYDNTKLFKCFTECNDTFDIYELVCKVKNNNKEYKEYYSKEGLSYKEWQLFDAIEYVAIYFGYSAETSNFNNDFYKLEDWIILNRYSNKNKILIKKDIELKYYDDLILKYYPKPYIQNWIQEGIKKEICDKRGICYNAKDHGIIIPHYDINNHLIGIRERTLIKENEVYGKYRPAILNGIMYNHPLGFSLYNLNNSKNNIKIIKKVFIFEGEKSTLLYASYFGEENDISVACCGSNLTTYQFMLLYSLGIEELIICFDKQFQELGDEEWERWTNKLYEINNKYKSYVKVSFLFDKWSLLEYKDAPIDKGKDIFLELYNKRIEISA